MSFAFHTDQRAGLKGAVTTVFLKMTLSNNALAHVPRLKVFLDLKGRIKSRLMHCTYLAKAKKSLSAGKELVGWGT